MRLQVCTLLSVLLLLLEGCGQSIKSTCHVQTEQLRSRVSTIEWSRIQFSAHFPYQRVPQGAGRLLPWGVNSVAALDGTMVEFRESTQPPGADLKRWLAVEGDRYTILHPDRSDANALYLTATADTKVSRVRTVIEALEPFAIIRLVVRPTTAEQPAWRPSREFEGAYADATRRGRYDDEHYVRLREVSLSSAAGCPEAVQLVNLPGMQGPERLKLLPQIFEKCRCGGDMQTLAALYWWMTFEWTRPARWLPWDPAVAAQLGEDASYEQLVAAMVARESGPVP